MSTDSADDAPAKRMAARVVVVVVCVACMATQPPKWSLDAPVPKASAPAAGKALRVTLEASKEPSLHGPSGGSPTTWEDRNVARTSWPGRGEIFVDSSAVPTASIGDRCTSGGGLCSSCDPPPGEFVRVLGITEVDIWTAEATALVPLGPGTRIDIEITATREPRVVSSAASSGSCGPVFGAPPPSGSSLTTAAAPPASAPSAPSSAPSAAPSSAGPAPSPPSSAPAVASPAVPTSLAPRRMIFSCWVDAATTITATIRGACTSGPCAPPAGEAIAILGTTRVP